MVAGEIPLLSSFLYLLGEAERVRRPIIRRTSRSSGAKRRSGARRGCGRSRAVSAVASDADLRSRTIRSEDTARLVV